MKMSKEVNERELVLGILMDVTRDGVMSHIAVRNVLEKYQYLDKRERAFITRVSEGTLERMLELDYILDHYAKIPVRKMKPVIRNILRSAVYQMKYMDSVPVSAACNEAVKLAVQKGFGNLRGFVNGVLRSVARNLDHLPLPDPKDLTPYWSVRYSVPEWIVAQWREEYGDGRTLEMLEALYQERPTSIRVNENKVSAEELKRKLEQSGVRVKMHPRVPGILLVSGYDHLAGMEGYAQGEFLVQDAASAEVAMAAGIRRGDYVIDVCAAPGGKALHAAQILQETGHVEARDVSDAKVEMIRENIARMGFSNIEAVCMDATVYDRDSGEKADVLLADLPCSGLGVLSRKTDLKYRVQKTQQEELAALQRKILETVRNYVKPGGVLMYSTCTVHRAENEENAAWFAEKFPEFELDWEKQIFPSAQEETDGFFLARFVRRR